MVVDWLMVIITAIYVGATIWISISNRQSVQAVKEQTRVLKQQLTHQVEQEETNQKKKELDFVVFSAFASTKSIMPRNGTGRLCVDEIYSFEPIKKLGVNTADIDESIKRLLYEQKIFVFFESEKITEQQYKIAREVQ